MDITSFVEIGIIGSSLSLVIQYIKNKFGTESNQTKVLTLVLSTVIGTGFYFLQGTAAWASILGILGAASAFYSFLLK